MEEDAIRERGFAVGEGTSLTPWYATIAVARLPVADGFIQDCICQIKRSLTRGSRNLRRCGTDCTIDITARAHNHWSLFVVDRVALAGWKS